MKKKLGVENLTISFRTVNGNVQAVRDISFNLYEGETLCIVGESGSGKSVTSRAILGILAKNAIVQGGKIFYDGKNLLKISEDDFHRIRGDKIAMIFQDPMSSLNPIMRVGKQLTEAMILKNRANRRESRRIFNKLLSETVKYMNLNETDETIIKENEKMASDFNQFEVKHLSLENEYDLNKETCNDLNLYIKDVLFRIEKNQKIDYKKELKYINQNYKQIQGTYFAPDIKVLVDEVTTLNGIKNLKKPSDEEKTIITTCLNNIISFLEKLENDNKVKYNFFALGYYLTFEGEKLPEYKDISDLNKKLRKVLDDNFMLKFISKVEKALDLSGKESIENSKNALELLRDLRKLDLDVVEYKEYKEKAKYVVAAVEKSIDALDIYRQSPCYTFKYGIYDLMRNYFTVDSKNAKEKQRYDKDKAKYDKLTAKGKVLNWAVVPQTIWDKEELKSELENALDTLIEYLDNYCKSSNSNLNAHAIEVIDYFKEKASNVATIVTKKVAKNKAIKLMEEVGINDPRRRYKQYPFEFSGGMRQRIVIAIALAANPDILICDEPTTALDVTIQSQILELINRLKRERNLSIIFITHDMGVVANMADRIAVMYAGKIVEIGTSEDIFYNPKHPYTWALLSSMPDLDTKEKLESIPGTPPNMIYPPKGDAFAARNKYAMKIDFEQQPPLFKVSDTHYAATWLLHPNAPKVPLPATLVDRIARMKERVNNNAK